MTTIPTAVHLDADDLPEGYTIDETKIRQGDIYLKRVDKLPDGLTKREDRTLALGEQTGHHHSFTETSPVAVLGEMDGIQFVVVDEGAPAELTHQEHGTQLVDPGIYEVGNQREYTPAAPRRVID